MSEAKVFELSNFKLTNGITLPQARIVYQTYGTLAPDRSNVILYPTSYGAQHSDIEWLISPDGILDPTRWFVVVPNMFGNGLSSSPSNLAAFETVVQFSHDDNVHAQARLLREVFGISHLALVYGWSMGAQQAFYWAALYPNQVARVAALCGTARTTDHNTVFLNSLESALQADPCWDGTRFTDIPTRGFRAFARIYASWAASQAFYRAGIYRQLGYSSLEDYLVRAWEASYRRRNPMDLLAMLSTWRRCDVSANPTFEGNLKRALGSITARVLVMPSTTDLYFTPEDCEANAAAIPHATFLPIPSLWGRRAGNPYQHPPDAQFIRKAVQGLLSEETATPKN